jgi:Ca2+-binding EF-hand superfamily protein
MQADSWDAPAHAHNDLISIGAWYRYILHWLQHMPRDPGAEARKAFRAMDTDIQGFIGRQQWRNVVAHLAPHLDQRAVDDAFTGLVGNAHGVLDGQTFCAIADAPLP